MPFTALLDKIEDIKVKSTKILPLKIINEPIRQLDHVYIEEHESLLTLERELTKQYEKTIKNRILDELTEALE